MLSLPGLRTFQSPRFRWVVAWMALGLASIGFLAAAVAGVAAAGSTNDYHSIVPGARRLLEGNHGVSVYAVPPLGPFVNFLDGHLLTYPPSFALLVAPLLILPDLVGRFVWLTVDLACVGFCLWTVYVTLGRPGKFELVVVASLVMLCSPVRATIEHLQFTPLLAALFCGATLCWIRRRPILGGLLIGLTMTLKPASAVVLAFFALRRNWAFVLAGLGAVIVIFMATLLAGWGPWWVQYYELAGALASGTGRPDNQSLNGFVLRALAPDRIGLPIFPVGLSVRLLIYGLDAVVVGATVWLLGIRRRPAPDPARAWLEIVVVLSVMPLLEPFAWLQHWAPAWLVLIPLAGRQLAAGGLSRAALLALVAAYVMADVADPVLTFATNQGAGLAGDPALRWFSSLFLYAMVLALVGLAIRLRDRGRVFGANTRAGEDS